MDAYSVYLNTFRYVMNADPSVKSSWCDIFKYLPCLRRMLSCTVCGSLLRNPHGHANGVCLHHVCYKCLGGKIDVKPSCNWCKDASGFIENKKLRVLVLCFKRLCAYITNSRLGLVIHASSVNGHDNDLDNTQKALQDADQFDDEYELTPPPTEPSGVLNQKVKEHNYLLTEYKPSTSGFSRKQENSCPEQSTDSPPLQRQGRGRKKKISNIAPKPSPKSNASIHVKRLKRKALSASRRNDIKSKNPIRPKKVVPITSEGLLISQRPHRELSGKCSVGQLWRETFLEKPSPELEIYPDSGIEIGNLSDQDHCSQSPKLPQRLNEVKQGLSLSINAKVSFPMRDTRLHPVTEENETTSTSDGVGKSKLSLKIPKRCLQKIQRKYSPRGSYFKKKKDMNSSHESSSPAKIPISKLPQIRRRAANTAMKNSLKQRIDICRCARFKCPNRLTCLGQKCPCYRDKKPCVNCLCNGCKNPRRHPDSAPPLMHVTKAKDTQCLSPDSDITMPRLSPIPRM